MRAVFLDRDGVINELIHYPKHSIIDSPFTVEQFKLCDGVGKAIKKLQEAGYKVVIASNQPGIAKEHMSKETFDKIGHKMREELAKDGVRLDGEKYCLHHPEAKVEKLRVNCECRKPRPGMLLQAAQEMNVDLSQSWLIGDGLSDIKAGKLAGTHTLLIGRMKCELCKLMDEDDARPDLICENLLEASQMIGNKVHAIQRGGLL